MNKNYIIIEQVRAGIVGYPNVGKSSLINRLLKRRMCPAAPRPGVTRVLKYIFSSFSFLYIGRSEIGGMGEMEEAFSARFKVIILALIALLEGSRDSNVLK